MFLRHVTGFRSFLSQHGLISMGALEGSSNTNPREMSSRRKPGRPRSSNIIITLDPNKFAEKKQQRFHIGGKQSFTPSISLHKQSSPVKCRHINYDLTSNIVSYPPDTRAFLYYYMSPERPRIAGELRFRVTSSDDPASFESGSDLLLTNGHPWSRPLFSLSKYYIHLYQKLMEERLVPSDLDTVLSTLSLKRLSFRRSIVLYTLNDPFIMDFSMPEMQFFAITEQGVEDVRFCGIFVEHREMCIISPYTGSALVRFERLTLPDHKGTRTVVLRFLKIITPVKCVIPQYAGHIRWPKEGELHQRSRKHFKVDQSVWGVNIDKSKGSIMTRGLRLLWDT